MMPTASLMIPQWFAEAFVGVKEDDGFGKLQEIPEHDLSGIVDGTARSNCSLYRISVGC